MTIAEELLLGPRGRRLCLGYVTKNDETLRSAVFWLGHELDPHPGTLMRFGWSDTAGIEDPAFAEAEVAELIRHADLASISEDAVREAMCNAVDHARYWQEPDGEDAIAALPVVRDALSSVAERLVTLMPALTAPFVTAQWAVDWRVASESAPIERSPTAVLARWTREQREEERSAQERPGNPHAKFTGTWWSVPQQLLETRANAIDALELVEDFPGWEIATVIPVRGAGRILEIGSATDWANLCREFPMEVTASRRHDWFRVTGHDGRWLIPDWERVAQRWDAVHLTTLGYLSAATKRIDIDSEFATVIAGWGPDSTIWLADVAREWDERRQQWNRLDCGMQWTRAETESSQS